MGDIKVVNPLLLLLIRKTTLTVWALWVALSSVTILLCAIDLLRLSVLARLSASRLIADRRQLGTTHLRSHHVLLGILAGLALRLSSVLTGPCSFLSLTLLLRLSGILLFLLLRFPLFANFLKF